MNFRRLTALLLTITLLTVAHYSPPVLAIMREVKVLRDGVQLTFPDQKPVIEAGRTLVPVRFVSEALGASVEWDESSKKVTIQQSGRTIALVINQRTVHIGDKEYTLDVPAKILNGRTLVPLRFVSEVLGTHVEWNERQHAVQITTSKAIYLLVGETVTVQPFSGMNAQWNLSDGAVVDLTENTMRGTNVGVTTAVARTVDGVFSRNYTINVLPERFTSYKNTHFSKDFVEITIIDNNTLEIRGATLSNSDRVWVSLIDGVNGLWNDQRGGINQDKTYTLTLKVNLQPGQHKLAVYMALPGESRFAAQDWDIPVIRTETDLFFPVSPVYKNNVQIFASNRLDVLTQTRVNSSSEHEVQKLYELATSITKGITDDYEKIFAISNWVSDNIYYDWDAYRTGRYGRTDAYGTLESKRSVCQGYAELTAALIRSVGIPCKVVIGHALGASARGKGWDGVDHAKTNHAWNEAFVNGRWVIMDTTWNSGNRYENGEYKPGNRRYKYFDCTLEAFSVKHKIIN